MRRFVDAAVAVVGLFFLFPLLVGIALAILLTSRGNPFYAARRIGISGGEFRMWKFRTMVAGADRGSSITCKRDRRVTPFGRILRRTKLDELPQLLNVVNGDMTLVGPRPEAPDLVVRYSAAQRRVLTVKPGLTGISQIAAGDESETIPESANPTIYYIERILDRKVAADLAYIDSRTGWSDLWIVFATIGGFVGGLAKLPAWAVHLPSQKASVSSAVSERSHPSGRSNSPRIAPNGD